MTPDYLRLSVAALSDTALARLGAVRPTNASTCEDIDADERYRRASVRRYLEKNDAHFRAMHRRLTLTPGAKVAHVAPFPRHANLWSEWLRWSGMSDPRKGAAK